MIKKKLILNNLSIEMTRQCQLSCQHCLRGPSQKKYSTPNLDALDDFLKNIDYVSSVTFTGGEPTLVSFVNYQFIINSFKQAKVGIGSFYLATNGISLLKTQTEQDFYQLISFLYANCDDNEVSGIKFSRDQFHKQELSFEKNKLIDSKIYKFTNCFNDNLVIIDDKDSNLISEGNAKKHQIGERENSTYLEIDNNVIDGDIYLNCKGNVIAGCAWSYRNQDKLEHIISTANCFDLQHCIDFQNQTN